MSTTWPESVASRPSISAAPAAIPLPTRSWAGSRRNALRYRPCPTGSASANRTAPGLGGRAPVQVVLVAGPRHGGRPGQATVGIGDLLLDRPDRHVGTPTGQPDPP